MGTCVKILTYHIRSFVTLFQYPNSFFARGGYFVLIPLYIPSFVLGNRQLYRRPSGLCICLAYGNHRER